MLALCDPPRLRCLDSRVSNPPGRPGGLGQGRVPGGLCWLAHEAVSSVVCEEPRQLANLKEQRSLESGEHPRGPESEGQAEEGGTAACIPALLGPAGAPAFPGTQCQGLSEAGHRSLAHPVRSPGDSRLPWGLLPGGRLPVLEGVGDALGWEPIPAVGTQAAPPPRPAGPLSATRVCIFYEQNH